MPKERDARQPSRRAEGGDRRAGLARGVARAVAAADPLGLLAAGAPRDEYDLEVATLLPRLEGARGVAEVQVLVHQEFVRWFGAEVAGPVEGYRAAAEGVWRAVREVRGGEGLPVLRQGGVG